MTLFEKIIAREIPADIVYETDDVLAFRDIAPQAPVHVLVVPKIPIPKLSDAAADHTEVLGRVLLAAAKVAELEGLTASGFRVVINNGEGAGQTVFHLHAHVLGGREFSWPPG